ncbi:MAG: hypothetical protein ABIC95_06665 [archaeon]
MDAEYLSSYQPQIIRIADPREFVVGYRFDMVKHRTTKLTDILEGVERAQGLSILLSEEPTDAPGYSLRADFQFPGQSEHSQSSLNMETAHYGSREHALKEGGLILPEDYDEQDHEVLSVSFMAPRSIGDRMVDAIIRSIRVYAVPVEYTSSGQFLAPNLLKKTFSEFAERYGCPLGQGNSVLDHPNFRDIADAMGPLDELKN